MSLFAVVGATGSTGSVVARGLLARGHRVRALVRNPVKAAWLASAGAELAKVDLGDREQVARAFDGVTATYVVNPPAETLPDPLRHAMRIADCLAEGLDAASVERAIVLSSIGAQRPAGTGLILTTHLTEQRLRSARAETTFLRCAFFLENWLAALQPALRSGTLPSELQDVDQPREFVGAQDIGGTAIALLTGELPARPLVELAGAQAWTPNAVAAALGRAAGLPLRAESTPPALWADPLRQHGLSEAAMDGFVEMFTAFDSGTLSFEKPDQVRRGHDPLEKWAERAVARLHGSFR